MDLEEEEGVSEGEEAIYTIDPIEEGLGIFCLTPVREEEEVESECETPDRETLPVEHQAERDMEGKGATPLLCDICAAPVRPTQSQDMATSPIRDLHTKSNSTQIYSSFGSSSNSNFSFSSSFNPNSHPSYSFSSLDFNSLSHSTDSGLSVDSDYKNKNVNPAADRFQQWFQTAISSAEPAPLLSRAANVPRDSNQLTKESTCTARLSTPEHDLSIAEKSFLSYHPSPGSGDPLSPPPRDRPKDDGYFTTNPVTGPGPRCAKISEPQQVPDTRSQVPDTRLPRLNPGSQPPLTTPYGPGEKRPLHRTMPNQASQAAPCGRHETRSLPCMIPDRTRGSSLPPL